MSRAMKDSGIPWIGEIPKDWKTNRLKSVFASRISGEWGDDAQNDYNDRVCLRIADFDYKRLRFKHCESYTIRNYSKAEENLPYLKNGDILIEKSGGGEKTPVGRAIVYDLEFDKAMYANFMTRLRVKAQINPWFVEYMLSTLYAYGALNVYIKQTTGIQNLDITTMLEEEKIFLPSLAEQQKIAEFLDRKCADVDEMIALQEQIIEELKAYKQSVITEAVTKGLNPDVPMKDSGIEWIGQIPEHWEVKPFKAYYKTTKGLNITKENLVERGVPVISYGQIHSKLNTGTSICDGLIRYVPETYLVSNPECLSKKFDMFFADTSEDREGAGNMAFIDTDTPIFAGYHTIIARPKEEVKTKYFAYLTKTDAWRTQIRNSVSGVKVFSVSQKLINRAYIIIPTPTEQQSIADYLDKKCSEIDNLISIKLSKIDSLKEYKKSIIYEYVTGKKEVK